MLKEERLQAILSQVELHNRVLLTDIAEKLDVSIDTARRDVKELDKEQKLRKVHGGAISLGFTTDSSRNANIYALTEKMVIAEKAVKLLKDDAVIFIDGGTTCMELARSIPPDLKLTCFTMSLPVAMELNTKPNVEVIFIGGKISKEGQVAIGANATQALSQIRVDYGFIGTGYVDASDGLTDFDWDIVQVKKAIMQASKKTILLCISQKLNSRHRYKTCDMTAISTMITELTPDDDQLKLFRNNNVHLI